MEKHAKTYTSLKEILDDFDVEDLKHPHALFHEKPSSEQVRFLKALSAKYIPDTSLQVEAAIYVLLKNVLKEISESM